MRIDPDNTDATVLAELGSRLARTRLERNITQAQLAEEAGIGVATLERMERGESARLSSLIRVLRALGLLERLDALVPEPLPSPIERLRLRGSERRRASRAGPPPGPSASEPWQWGDEADPAP